MRVLVACEYSGVVRDAFIAAGHDAVSCDILPTESDGPHIQGDVLEVIGDGWDLMVAHPPCTHLSVSGARWFVSGYKPMSLRDDAIEFVTRLMLADIPHIAIENPVSVIASYIRPSDQVIQPWQFGHPECKSICLWLKNLPALVPTNDVKEEMMKLPVSVRNRIWYMGSGHGKERSRFFEGIAIAMAAQWGSVREPV